MTRPLLYSTNVYLKLIIQEKYYNDKHYVWCSEFFDNNSAAKHSSGALISPSSNPASIYRELKRDIIGKDKHSAKITAQKASFTLRAIQSFDAALISEEDKDEIIFMVEDAPFELWKPLLYVIPSDNVNDRLNLVPIEKRAGFGNEYIVTDLKRTEFDILEF